MIFTLKDKNGSRWKIKQSEAVDDYISRKQLEMLAEKLRGGSDEKFIFIDGEESLTVSAGIVARHGKINVLVPDAIRALCARENWYNAGTVPMYEHLLHDLVQEGDPVEVARDIFANTRHEGSIKEQRALLDDMIAKVTAIYKERG